MSRVAVVGAGVFGSWIAWRLAEDGHRVMLLDAYGPANGRASSADHSRVIRAGYGGDAIYSRWATESLREWEWLAAETGLNILTTTGALFMGEPDNAYIRDSYDTLTTLGLHAKWLEPAELAARHPQISIVGLGPTLLERDAGVLRARAAVQALVNLAVSRAHVEYRLARVVPLDEARSSPALHLSDGSTIHADAYVMACGPWLPLILPIAVSGRIRPTRQEVLYYGVPAGDERFSHPRLPVWIDFAAGVYGIPDVDSHGFKVGIDCHGPLIDPETADRVVDPRLVESTRDWLAMRFPGLAGAPLLDSRVCQYENTSSGDFIIDRHSAWPNVWIVGGGSGHGFKHGPAVARHVVELVAGRAEPDARFALATKTSLAERTVF